MKIKKNLLILFFSLGVIIRVFYFYYYKDTPFFNPALMDKHDQKTFHILAKQIQQHPWYVDGKVFYMAPFYSYFLSGLYSISREKIWVVYIFQIVIDIFLCYILYILAKEIINETAGIISAFFGCFYRTFIVYSISILSDSIILFLYIFFITSLYFSLKKSNIVRWIISGFLLGLSTLSKPTIAAYLPFLFLGLYFYPNKSMLPLKLKKSFQVIIVFGILIGISGLTILPVTIRNYWVGRTFVPICSNGFVNWKIGNSSDSIGLFYYPKGYLLSPFTLSFWKLQFKKLCIFFTNYEWPQNMNVYFMEKIIPVLKFAFIHFGFVSATGIIGLFLLFKNWRKNFLFITFTITNILWVVFFFIVDRYRLPAIGCFIISSSYFLIWCLEKLKQKSIFKILFPCFFVCIFYYLFNVPPTPLIPEMSYKIFYYLSEKNIMYEIEEGKFLSAFKKAKLLVKVMPEKPQAYYFLGLTYIKVGKIKEAKICFEKALEINPDFTPARQFLKTIEERENLIR